MQEGYRNLENSLIGPQLLKSAVEKSRGITETYSPNMKPFIGHYGVDAVKRDLEKVLRYEKRHAASHKESGSEKEKELASVFENLFLEAADTEGWFGNAELGRPTKFDDYVNGIDVLMTLFDKEDNATHLELSSDLTFGTQASSDKLQKVIGDIDRGDLAKVKYFHSDHMGFTGALTDVPRTVIGLDRTNLPEFIRGRVHGTVDSEPFRNTMLLQLQSQLKFFRNYADKVWGEHPIRRKYGQASRAVDTVISDLDFDRDNVLEDTITDNIRELGR